MNTMLFNTSDLMTTADAAVELGLSTDTVKKYCQKGEIGGLKIGHIWMVTKKEVARYQKERRPPGRPPT